MIVLEILRFIFSDFWIWLGFTITFGLLPAYAISDVSFINITKVKKDKADKDN